MFTPNMVFKKALLDVSLADKIKYCYQCGRCTDVCPVAKVTDNRYEPRSLIMASYIGLPQLALENPDNFMIWGCQVCDTCDEICPNDIGLTEIFSLIKNFSVQKGTAPDYYTTQAKTIYNNGKAIPMQDAIARRRTKMGLPEVIPPDVDEIKAILKETNLPAKLKLEGE